MGNTVCDIGKGTFGYYGTLPAASDSIIYVLFKFNASFPTDAAFETPQTLAAVLALANVAEADFSGYARISQTTSVVSIASHVTTLDDTVDPTWASATTGNTLQKLMACYKPATASVDSAIIPLGQYDFSAITDGSNLTAQINASGLMSCT